jgi:beta-lactamase class D
MKSILHSTALLLILMTVACTSNNVEKDDSIKKIFDDNKVTGCFAMYDNGQDKVIVYNLPRYRDSAYLPASTFKIVNSLIALETGVMADTSAIIKWDGVTRERTELNQDLSLNMAFRYSSLPAYQEIARRIGKDTMQRYLDTLGYGTKTITGAVDSFWINNTLKIKGDEQLGLMKKLYFEQVPGFKARPQRLVRGMMLMENNANYKLSFKTGWGFDEKKNSIGWMTGWIEENAHPYFFVLQIQTSDPNFDMRTVRMKILKEILKQKGFMEGKK